MQLLFNIDPSLTYYINKTFLRSIHVTLARQNLFHPNLYY
eukprot:UN08295